MIHYDKKLSHFYSQKRIQIYHIELWTSTIVSICHLEGIPSNSPKNSCYIIITEDRQSLCVRRYSIYKQIITCTMNNSTTTRPATNLDKQGENSRGAKQTAPTLLRNSYANEQESRHNQNIQRNEYERDDELYDSDSDSELELHADSSPLLEQLFQNLDKNPRVNVSKYSTFPCTDNGNEDSNNEEQDTKYIDEAFQKLLTSPNVTLCRPSRSASEKQGGSDKTSVDQSLRDQLLCVNVATGAA